MTSREIAVPRIREGLSQKGNIGVRAGRSFDKGERCANQPTGALPRTYHAGVATERDEQTFTLQ